MNGKEPLTEERRNIILDTRDMIAKERATIYKRLEELYNQDRELDKELPRDYESTKDCS